jgi:Brp/Blh family beta-carotene 15,15'-monooxygenase
MTTHRVASSPASPHPSTDSAASDAPQRAARGLLQASRGLLAALAVVFGGLQLAGVRLSIESQSIVYLVGMVAMNLPHGGFEHASNLWNRPLSFAARYVGLFAVAIALFVALLFSYPAVGLGLAITVAMVKGGHGGLRVLDATTGTGHLAASLQRTLAATVRGGAVMIVPMIAWPGTFLAFSQYMVNIFEPGALAATASNVPTVRFTLAAGYGTALALHLGWGLYASYAQRDAQPDALTNWAVDALETLLLVAYFTAVPVLVAVGLYFPVWYSLRQVARAVAAGDEEPADDASTAGSPLLDRLKSGGTYLAGTLATFGLMAALYVAFPTPMGGAPFWAGLVAFYSIFVSIIALPHIVVGAWLDRDRGIWYVP